MRSWLVSASHTSSTLGRVGPLGSQQAQLLSVTLDGGQTAYDGLHCSWGGICMTAPVGSNQDGNDIRLQ